MFSCAEEFLLSLRLEGKSPKTIALYSHMLRIAEGWAKVNDVSWDNLDPHVLRLWAASLIVAGFQSPRSHRLAAQRRRTCGSRLSQLTSFTFAHPSAIRSMWL